MLSAICFNLDQSKILPSGNGLTQGHHITGQQSSLQIISNRTPTNCYLNDLKKKNILSIQDELIFSCNDLHNAIVFL